MADGADSVDGPEMEQIKIVLNTLYLCIAFAMTHIAKHNGAQAAVDFKAELLSALKSGDLNMALMEVTKTFDFVIAKIEALGQPEA
ncbi:hypothetical protein [Bosea sp. WAO]|uniref:hypothetical protein n=1 Tax=Bosea sp. WAO TaxID=406341 RepID=UPI000A936C00|nr:hypothetical protein [Bosea sp. WAO]